MKNINWTIPGSLNNPELDIIIYPPEPAYKYLLEIKKGANYLECPSFPAELKNTFILRSPMDINIWIEKDGAVRTDSCDQRFYDNQFSCKKYKHGKYVYQIPPTLLFFTEDDEEVIAVSMPVALHETPNALFISGRFDISKWVRPLNYGFEVADETKPIQIKRGDPLYMVKFICKDNSTVQLNRVPMTPEIHTMQRACVNVKHAVPNLNLKTLYGMAAPYLKMARSKMFKS